MLIPRSVHRSALAAALIALWPAGCASPFNIHSANEVTRERLLELADTGAADHMQYMGSDRAFHYVYDERPNRQKTYKVRREQIELKERFGVGEDSYTLHPWLIEGDLLGTKPK
ncbi:MAG: hypothetical protein EXS05_00070 [Planctomycetaceae bacterium]|nr:hypothetical protein [Planctomycetaceae bacterium]